MANFTPGPWKVKHTERVSYVFSKTKLADVYSEAFRDTANQEANANLIAAAPEMHKQISGAITVIEDLRPDDLSNHALIMLREVLNNLKQVLAKAEGGQQ